jgi:hypothetical protein
MTEGTVDTEQLTEALTMLAEAIVPKEAPAASVFCPLSDEGWTAITFYAMTGGRPFEAQPDHGVQPLPSQMACTGQGLFTTRHWKKGSCICEYQGTVWPTARAIRWGSLPLHYCARTDNLTQCLHRLVDKSYLMRLGPQAYIDAKDHHSVLARYINDARNLNWYAA